MALRGSDVAKNGLLYETLIVKVVGLRMVGE
jgi:hypothetical protein